ncbi:oligosaccharide flippase family protein [Curtobacterium sp. NPDC089185]|uniref:oligosaccharide flippase family protein n=1 Tax=Curtobacterium sp. NPDC089185 TaxID=3154968 RepID=UPI0034250899
MVLLAFYMTPFEVGLYVWPMLILTFYYSALDGAVRQIVVPSWNSATAFRFLLRYRTLASLLGILAMLGTIIVLFVVFPEEPNQIFSLAPLLLVPVFNSFALIPLGFLQKLNQWRSLARMQVVAAAVSLLVSVPALVLTQSLLGASLQVLLTEAMFAFAAQRQASKLGMHEARSALTEGATYGREFAHSSVFFVGGWAQAQVDKVLVGVLAGTNVLGSYNFALAVARNPGDAISASTSNVLRVRLAEARDATSPQIARVTDQLMVKALAIATVVVLVIAFAVRTVLVPVLGSEWGTPLRASMIALISIIPTVLSWALPIVMLTVGRMKWAAWVRVVGIVAAIPIAFAAADGLEGAAWLLLAREFVMLALFAVACGRAVPVKALAFCSVVTAALSLAALWWV